MNELSLTLCALSFALLLMTARIRPPDPKRVVSLIAEALRERQRSEVKNSFRDYYKSRISKRIPPLTSTVVIERENISF